MNLYLSFFLIIFIILLNVYLFINIINRNEIFLTTPRIKKKIFIEEGNMIGEKKSIIYNGLNLNPNTVITKNIEDCDYIFMDFRDYNKVKMYDPKYFKKLIIIDYRDNKHDLFNIPCLKYFKRSVVDKNNLKFVSYNREVIPISYSLKNEVLNFGNIYNSQRHIDISVFFNVNVPGATSIFKHRCGVANFIKEKFKNYKINVGLVGKSGELGRNSIQQEYYNKMRDSKIIVTCNPSNWEGDYRTWESLSSGALVMVDKMITPKKNPLIDRKHIVYYDRDNLEQLKGQLLYYLKNPDLARKIGKEGREYALKYHKSSDRINEILSYL